MKRSVIVVVGVLACLWHAQAEAVVLCKKPAGAVVARERCKSRETTLTAAELGLGGARTDSGAVGTGSPVGTTSRTPAGVRAYAAVDRDTVRLVGLQTLNFTSVTRVSTGRYCLTPVAGIDPDSVVAAATVDHSRSVGADNLVQLELDRFACPLGTFEILTFTAGRPSNDVSFAVLVP